ncbi:metal-dependent hydrolase [Streptosporangium sp. NPDC048047]|uniref:metal-dependent hydrolase n=1 Tax=Streptosporangium sp. NPDC048047 TaxID=3155748 RepID=UPI0034445FBE
MMGHTHALTGAVAWLGVAPTLAALPLLTDSSRFVETGVMVNALNPSEFIAGTIICAGAAMLPDLDHPSATIAQTFGPITWMLSKAVAWVSGGHRHATHSLVFAAAAGFGAHYLANTYPIGRDILVALLIGLAIRAIGIGVPGNKMATAMVDIGLAAGLFVVFRSYNVGYAWLGLAVGIGCLIHVVGDCCTEKGCPVLWPVPGRWVLPWKIGIKTGQAFEQKLLAPVLSIAIVGLIYLRFVQF